MATMRRNSIGVPGSSYRGKAILSQSHRASISSCHVGGNSRRNSTGIPSSQNSEEDVLPHYLRASTGSCHDFCKYGRKHAHELKSRNPIPKRTATSSSNEEKSIRAVVPAERKKTTVVNPKPTPVPKIHSPETPEIIKREIQLPSKKVEVTSKRDSSIHTKITKNELKVPAKKHSPSVKPKPVMVKPSSSSDAFLNGRSNGDIKIGKKMGIPKSVVKKVLATPTASLSPKPSVSRVVSLKVRKCRNLKLVSPLKDQKRMPKTDHKQTEDVKVREKTEPKQPDDVKFREKTEPKQPDDVKVQEKTLHVVEAETENKVLESVPTDVMIQSPPSPSTISQNSQSSCSDEEDLDESEYTNSEEDDFISENDEIINTNGLVTSKRNYKRTPRKGRVIRSEDRDGEVEKLKFRRGMVVDLPSENNGPRRLRFRRGRVLGDNEDGQGVARRRSFKKKGVDNETTNDTSLSSTSVVLKHQDVQGKKDAQGLLNNVIEETASKLVESRKSKVMALVGAFETVISLQDGKPSTQTVT